MAVAFVVGSTAQSSFTARTSFSNALNFTTVGGTGHLLVVSLHFSADPGTITSVTYNGVAMSSAGATNVNGSDAIAIFYLLGPAAGNNTLAAAWTNSVDVGWLGGEFSGVNTTTPVANFVSATGTSSTMAVTATTVNGDAAFAAYTNAGSNEASNTQTLIVADQLSDGTHNMAASYGLASGSSVAFSWSCFVSAAWAASAIDIQATVGPTTYIPYDQWQQLGPCLAQ